ncbi:aliphatic nitrilase-like [Penaeus monodon]|uniref:aliphatic nitrilase-like n=1 Tax=Penaeus monodon TaxID=6687 RepID=UPI0018A7CEE4|nr:aliphatic nitrilase-like [Penaeus monodon]
MPKTVIAPLQIGQAQTVSASTVENILKYEPENIETGCKCSSFGTRLASGRLRAETSFSSTEAGGWTSRARSGLTLQAGEEKRKTFIVVGIVERGGSTLYCTALFISDQGEVVAKHRKVLPTASERLIWGRGDASTLPLVKTPAGLAGAAICWENYMPSYATPCTPKASDLVRAHGGRKGHLAESMKHISYEGRHIPGERMPVPASSLGRDDCSFGAPGGVGRPCVRQEALLKAEIDLDDIIRARYDMDVVGHYARPDIFQLVVDEKPKNSMDCQ